MDSNMLMVDMVNIVMLIPVQVWRLAPSLVQKEIMIGNI